MWFPAFGAAFLVAVAYFQAIQGFTSAAITGVLSILCMAISFASYEYVAESFLMGMMPAYAHGVALLGMFVVPFGILRLILDKVIPRSSLFPQIVDWIGGGAFGVIAGVVTAGVLTLSIEMLPWGSEGFMGYSRFNPEKPEEQNNLWLNPDRAVVSMASMLSGGVFNSTRMLSEDHPDLVSEIGQLHSLPRGVKRVVPPDSVSLAKVDRVAQVYIRNDSNNSQTPATYDAVDPEPGQVFTLVTLQLSADAADEDKSHRYTPASVRLVGTLNDKPVWYHAIAVGDRDTPHRQVKAIVKGRGEPQPVVGKLMRAAPNGQIDVVFEHPEAFKPKFVEYKMGGRVPLDASKISSASPASSAAAQTTASSSTGGSDSSGQSGGSGQQVSQPSGRVSGVKFRSTHFGGDLPVTMTSYQGRDVDERGGELIQGHIQGNLADQGSSGGSTQISKLKVPDGKALLQLNVESLRAGSTLGRALNWSVQTVENYLLHDDRGNQYQPVGKYAVANVGGNDYVEILYFPELAQSGARFGTFSKIKNQHLKGDYQLVYLFAVNPGTKVVKFTTGGIKRPVDLSKLNLVAP